VELDLVDGWDDGGYCEKSLEKFDGEVGDTDRLELIGVGLVQSLHGFPGIDPVVSRISFHLLGHGCGPVHEPKIEVTRLQLAQGILQRLGSPLVMGVVKFGGQKEGFTGDA